MRKALTIAFVLGCAIIPSSAQRFYTFVSVAPPAQTVQVGWKPLKGAGGAGGFQPGLDIATDGTEVSRADTYGIYLFNTSEAYCGNSYSGQPAFGCQDQLFLASNTPAGTLTATNADQGTYEARVCHGNSQQIYAYLNNRILSYSRGTKQWSNTAFASYQANGNDTNRTGGPFMDCDPNNSAVLVTGTPFNGVFATTTSGTSYTSITTVPPSTGTLVTSSVSNNSIGLGSQNYSVASCAPFSANEPLIVYETSAHGNAMFGTGNCTTTTLTFVSTQDWGSGIGITDWSIASLSANLGGSATQNNFPVAVDPTSVSGGTSQIWYVGSQGNGICKSTTGPTGTYSHVTGSSANTLFLNVDKFGDVWQVDFSGNLYQCFAPCSSFAINNAISSVLSISVDPTSTTSATATVTVTGSAMRLATSTNGGGTFTSYDGCCHIFFTANDIPWLGFAASTPISIAKIVYNPAVAHQLVAGTGVGIYTTTSPELSTPTVNWSDQSAGMQQLVSNEIVWPVGGNAVYAAWDFGTFYVNNPDAYASTQGLCSAPGGILATWSLDWAMSQPQYISCLANFFGQDASGRSTNFGQAFTNYTSLPSSGAQGGCIAQTTSQNILITPVSAAPYLTTNAGTAWAIPAGFSALTTGWPTNYYLHNKMCTKDLVTPNLFYVYNYADGTGADGIYQVTSAGAVTRECTNCGGGGQNFNNGGVNAFDVTMFAMPGVAGELWWTAGQENSQPTPLWHSTNGGATWATISGVESYVIGYGATKSGSSFASVYFSGTLSGTVGTYVSNNDGVSWQPICSDGFNCAYPLGVTSQIETIAGNMNAYGTIAVGTHGMGPFYYSGLN